MIVDLNGNDVCETEDYRLYCIFYLRKLKVARTHSHWRKRVVMRTVCRMHSLAHGRMFRCQVMSWTLCFACPISRDARKNHLSNTYPQVLDGKGVDGMEQHLAHDAYADKLTYRAFPFTFLLFVCLFVVVIVVMSSVQRLCGDMVGCAHPGGVVEHHVG